MIFFYRSRFPTPVSSSIFIICCFLRVGWLHRIDFQTVYENNSKRWNCTEPSSEAFSWAWQNSYAVSRRNRWTATSVSLLNHGYISSTLLFFTHSPCYWDKISNLTLSSCQTKTSPTHGRGSVVKSHENMHWNIFFLEHVRLFNFTTKYGKGNSFSRNKK